MTKNKKTNKQRKDYKRYVEPNSIKTTSKKQHSTGWINHYIGINDPLNKIYMPHEVTKFVDVEHFCIPYTYNKNNSTKSFVNFTKADSMYIEYWLTRLENEICHKSLAHQYEMFNFMLQPVNHYSTHEAVGKENSTLTMISGLRANFLRNGEDPEYVAQQLPMIEHCFWMGWWFLRGYYLHLNQSDQMILTDKDIGFRKKTGAKNPMLYPIHFVESKVKLADDVNFTETDTITL